MTITGWISFVAIAVLIAYFGCLAVAEAKKPEQKMLAGIIAVILIFIAFFGFQWYFQNTASGQRAVIDQKSELANGLERTITVYAANGLIIAQYTGKIDIEGNDGGYVLFDYDGKRYTYYNCFVESIADIG